MAWIHDWTWREYVPGVVARGISRLALPWEPEWDAWPVPVETAREAERAQMSQPGRRTGRTLAVQYDLGQVMIERLQALRRQVIETTTDAHPEQRHVVLVPPYAYRAMLAWFWEHEPDGLPQEQRQQPDRMRVMGWHVFPSEAVHPVQAWELVPMAPEAYVQAREDGEDSPRCMLCRQPFPSWHEASTHLVFGGCPAQSRGQRLAPVGDGITDDTEAMRQALDRPITATEIMRQALNALGEHWVRHPPGVTPRQSALVPCPQCGRVYGRREEEALRQHLATACPGTPPPMTDFGEPTYDALDAAGELGGMTLEDWSAWLDREERETP